MRKRVLISGASRGIGEACAYELASAGYDLVLLCAHSIERLTEIGKQIEEKYNVTCIVKQCDVGNDVDVRKLFSELGDETSFFALINNAAISHIGLMTDMSVLEWRRVIDVNLNSCFLMSKEVIPSMLKNHAGKIINISSVWGNVGASCEVAYSASKGGVNAFTKALAKELAPSNIQVNAVAFGVIDTDMNKCFTKEEMDSLIEEIPADRIGRCDEAAKMIRGVLESPEYLTGQIITMDGGFV